MKNNLLLLTLLVALGTTSAYSQTVNGKRISDIDVEYIEIVGRAKRFSPKLNIQIDFGQEDRGFSTKDTQIRDRKNKPMLFNSMVEALNYMSANGYDFVDSYSIVNSNDSAIYYLMKKREDEAKQE